MFPHRQTDSMAKVGSENGKRTAPGYRACHINHLSLALPHHFSRSSTTHLSLSPANAHSAGFAPNRACSGWQETLVRASAPISRLASTKALACRTLARRATASTHNFGFARSPGVHRAQQTYGARIHSPDATPAAQQPREAEPVRVCHATLLETAGESQHKTSMNR